MRSTEARYEEIERHKKYGFFFSYATGRSGGYISGRDLDASRKLCESKRISQVGLDVAWSLNDAVNEGAWYMGSMEVPSIYSKVPRLPSLSQIGEIRKPNESIRRNWKMIPTTLGDTEAGLTHASGYTA